MQYQKYTPVDPDFTDIINTQAEKPRSFRIFFFQPNHEIGQSDGKYNGIRQEPDGEFIELTGDKNVRLDRIITVNGKPGPAFDEYDAYANACSSCQAGYED